MNAKLCKNCAHYGLNIWHVPFCMRLTFQETDLVTGQTKVCGKELSLQDERKDYSQFIPFRRDRCGAEGKYFKDVEMTDEEYHSQSKILRLESTRMVEEPVLKTVCR